MRDPSRVPREVRDRLRTIGLWDVDPANLFRITWKNEPVDRGGTYGGVNAFEIPSSITGVPARTIGLVGHWFPTGAHKVGATYGCLAPSLVRGVLTPSARRRSGRQRATTVGAARTTQHSWVRLGCDSPEGMSRERFEWLRNIAGEVISTPGPRATSKKSLTRVTRSLELAAKRWFFNQFDELGNYLWHYEVTGSALEEVLAPLVAEGLNVRRIRLRYGKRRHPRCRRPAQAALSPREGHRR
jgi:cysteine synthase A